MNKMIYTLAIAILLTSGCNSSTGPEIGDSSEDGDPIKYTLITSSLPAFYAGTITPSGGEFEEGEQITLQAEPNDGWRFSAWDGDKGDIDDVHSASIAVTMPSSNIWLKANFEQVDDGTWPRDTDTEVVEVTSATGRIWMDRNLGASRAATSSTDTQAYGGLYQWGRAADGHQIRTSGTLTELSNRDRPGHDYFILSRLEPWDWRFPQNDNLWQGVNGTNNPCPIGYRLPTAAEWAAELQSWSSNDAAGAFASPLKLPVAGWRQFEDGSLNAPGHAGGCWSSTKHSLVYTYGIAFGISAGANARNVRAYGISVRCIKD